MALTFLGEEGNVLNFKIAGEFKKFELDAAQSLVLDAIKKYEKIKLFIVLEDFEGWEKGADWSDVSFSYKHDKEIEKMAIVGDLEWKDLVLIFAGDPFTQTSIKYFEPSESESANLWLAG